MTMTLSEFNRLRKTMMLTTSPNDHEALSALRKANEVLANFNYTWEDVFQRLVKIPGPEIEAAPEERSERSIINEAFATVEAKDPRGSFADFIASLKDQWERTGRLSAAQRDSLLRAAR